MLRGQTNPRSARLKHIWSDLRTIRGDLLDQGSLLTAVDSVQPDEVYNLGAISYVPLSWQQPGLTMETNGMGVLRMLEAIRLVTGATTSRPAAGGQIRFYQASSSEMFGKVCETPQNEQTPFHPRSPYGAAKAYGHYITKNYRESYGMHATSGILFNHESPRRGPEFVTRKVSLHVAQIKLGLAARLQLGNLDAYRDWGFAADYVRSIHQMVRQEIPADYVIGTGETYSVRELVELAFSHVGLDWRKYVEIDPTLVRPAEVDLLCSDAKNARINLGWEPSVSFAERVGMMVDADLKMLSSPTSAEDEFMFAEHW
jgi:GDPmannose 4,6-dehydratase